MRRIVTLFRLPVTVIYEKRYKFFVVLPILLIFDEGCDIEGKIKKQMKPHMGNFIIMYANKRNKSIKCPLGILVF